MIRRARMASGQWRRLRFSLACRCSASAWPSIMCSVCPRYAKNAWPLRNDSLKGQASGPSRRGRRWTRLQASQRSRKGSGRMLILSNEEIESLLTMELALKSLERAYIGQARGTAVNRPRSDLYLPGIREGSAYAFKTMTSSHIRLQNTNQPSSCFSKLS